MDASNNIYLTGATNGVANYDYATIKYTPTGGQSNVITYNGTANGSDIPQAIIFKSNFIYVTGSSFGTNAQSDFTTVKYDSATLSVADAANSSTRFKVYPNPAKNTITIDLSEMGSLDFNNIKLALVDMTGRNVLTIDEPQQAIFELNVENLKTGTYLLEVLQGTQKTGFKKIIIN